MVEDDLFAESGVVPDDYADLVRRILDDRTGDVPLVPGMLVYVELRREGAVGSPKLASRVVGWRDRAFILCDIPRQDGVRIVAEAGQEVVVRFLREGVVYGFGSTLLRVLPAPMDLWVIECPHTFEAVCLRRHRRYRMLAPCVLRCGSEHLRGIVRDLSLGGAQLFSDERVNTGQAVALTIALPGGTILRELPANVQNVRRTGRGFEIGVLFAGGASAHVREIQRFLEQVLTDTPTHRPLPI